MYPTGIKITFLKFNESGIGFIKRKMVDGQEWKLYFKNYPICIKFSIYSYFGRQLRILNKVFKI